MKPLVHKRDGRWVITYWFADCPVEYDTLPDAFNQALRYA